MSTLMDIKAAKEAFDAHVRQHKCIPVQEAIRRGSQPCPFRVPLWAAYVGGTNSAVGRWHTEPDDTARMTAQYANVQVG